MRPVKFKRGVMRHPAGSCICSFGSTEVIVSVCIENKVPPFLIGKGTGWLTADYAMLPGSTNSRKSRDHHKPDGRSVEIGRLIGRSLRAAVNLDRLPDKTLHIDCDVLNADGGTRTAAISGAWVALYDALFYLAKEQKQAAGPTHYLYGQLAAVSVGIVKGNIICDLDYINDSAAEVDCNVVMRDQDLVEVQGTGEKGVFNRAQFTALLDSAAEGIATIQAAQKAALNL